MTLPKSEGERRSSCFNSPSRIRKRKTLLTLLCCSDEKLGDGDRLSATHVIIMAACIEHWNNVEDALIALSIENPAASNPAFRYIAVFIM